MKGDTNMKTIRKRGVFFAMMLLLALGLVPASASDMLEDMSEATAADSAIIVDHSSVDITAIPQYWIEEAKSTLHIAYGHTSHGSQLTDGMSGLVGFANGGGKGLALPADIFAWNDGGTGGALDLHDYAMGGDVGYYPDWVDNTRNYLGTPDPVTGRGTDNPDVNVIIWSWCGQASGYTEQEMLDWYLTPMSELEADYPGVTFVYMTGHSDGTGESGNLHQRNQQIREYCAANGKVLYDFYNIELYDPDGNYYGNQHVNDNCDYDSGNWATEWQGTHTEDVDWYSCSCAHSQSLNCNQKAYAAWWLWARIAGWNGVTGDYVASDMSGNWSTGSVWDGDTVPQASNGVTITAGTTITATAGAECAYLTVEPGATLVVPDGVELSVAEGFANQGTVRMARTVNNGSVAFEIGDESRGIAHYRAVDITTPSNLGEVTVSVRTLGAGEYCTAAAGASNPYAQRCFEIAVTNNAAATVRLWALTDEMNGLTDPRVFRYVAPNWNLLATNAVTGTVGAYTYVQAETPGFSHFLIAQDSGAPTAITQLDLDARAVQSAIGTAIALILVLMTCIGLAVRWLRRKNGADGLEVEGG
jgi:hypothetical protein